MIEEIVMMEWPKRVRTVNWEYGILTLDNTKNIEVSELTLELMEKISEYSDLVGFHVKGYHFTDELLKPLAKLKNMVNFGIEDGELTDDCFSVFASMHKLTYLFLNGNSSINGSGLSAFGKCKLELLALNRTGLDDVGLSLAANISKLTHIHINHTNVTYDGIMAIISNKRLSLVGDEQFTKEELEEFSVAQRNKAKKKTEIDYKAVEQCQKVLNDFFKAMTNWEKHTDKVGFNHPDVEIGIREIWENYVSEKPRKGHRPLAMHYCPDGTYEDDVFIDAEQITKNKLYIYTKQTSGGRFEKRFLMKRVKDEWKIDAVQERLNGWERIGL